MPTPLKWTETAPNVIRASRVIPTYGTVICFIRTGGTAVRYLGLTHVILPEPPGHPPEVLTKGARLIDPATDVEFFKQFSQVVVDALEESIKHGASGVVAVVPS